MLKNHQGYNYFDVGPADFETFRKRFNLSEDDLPTGFEVYGVTRDQHGHLLSEAVVKRRKDYAEVGDDDGKNSWYDFNDEHRGYEGKAWFELSDIDIDYCQACDCHPGFVHNAIALINGDYANQYNVDKNRRENAQNGKGKKKREKARKENMVTNARSMVINKKWSLLGDTL